MRLKKNTPVGRHAKAQVDAVNPARSQLPSKRWMRCLSGVLPKMESSMPIRLSGNFPGKGVREVTLCQAIHAVAGSIHADGHSEYTAAYSAVPDGRPIVAAVHSADAERDSAVRDASSEAAATHSAAGDLHQRLCKKSGLRRTFYTVS